MVSKTDKENLRKALAAAFDNFSEHLSGFSELQVNKLFPSSGWTPAQVTTHIILSADGVPDQHTHPTARPYDAMLDHIRPWWEDMNQKFQSPEGLRPGNEPRSGAALLAELARIREKDLAIVDQQDLSLTCADRELPSIGYLTRYEWLWFIEMHLKRHTFQLANMFS
jgi:hypothetical protein